MSNRESSAGRCSDHTPSCRSLSELLVPECDVAVMELFATLTSFQMPKETAARRMKRMMMMMAMTSFFFMVAVGESDSGVCGMCVWVKVKCWILSRLAKAGSLSVSEFEHTSKQRRR